jgi:hypothetical protein
VVAQVDFHEGLDEGASVVVAGPHAQLAALAGSGARLRQEFGLERPVEELIVGAEVPVVVLACDAETGGGRAPIRR